MSLQRSYTRFGPPSLRGVTPDSDDSSDEKRPLLAGPEYDPPHKLKKRDLAHRDSSQESNREYYAPLKARRVLKNEDREETWTDLRDTRMLQATQPRPMEFLNMKIKYFSPWDLYLSHFPMLLDNTVTIASRRKISSQGEALLVVVRQFSNHDIYQKDEMLQEDITRKAEMLQRIKNKNFLACLDFFIFEKSLYVVFEHELNSEEKLPITLRQYALIDPYPTEEELVLILGPILDGLQYLASEGLEHGALSCKNVLIGLKGSIKITGQECCKQLDPRRGSMGDIRGVGNVVLELINKDSRTEGPRTVHDTHLWPDDSQAVKFLLYTESAYSIDELKSHSLMRNERRQIGSDVDEALHREIVFKWKVYRAEGRAFRG